MHSLDYAIISAYLVGLLSSAIWLARRARASLDDYFLAGRGMPWWALGASGMASNLDVAGTMTLVSLISVYGLHGFWIEMRGGVVLPIAVFAAFMGKWHRRSGVMTTAEWMLLRFGDTSAGRAARFAAAGTYVVITIAMIAFFLSAGGRFLSAFVPLSPVACSIATALVAFVYTLFGGLYAVIWTDVAQVVLIGFAAVYISWVAFDVTTPTLLANWTAGSFNSFVPRWNAPDLGVYSAFGMFLLVWISKGLLEGFGGSGGSAYMAQRFYAARSDADCRRIGMLWTLLFAVRWPMVLGFALMVLHLGLPLSATDDVEGVLPRVISSDLFMPGIRGLVIAALLAAAMSTFDSTLNAGAAYVVKDLYEPLRPRASERELVRAGYVASALLVIAGLAFSLGGGGSVLALWTGIVMQLFPAFLVPFALRWFWARFNGVGFSAGIAGGFMCALYFWWVAPIGWNEATQFLAIASASFIVSLGATLTTEPVPAATLRAFYSRVRPFGLWPRSWRMADRDEHRADVLTLILTLVWQVLTFLIPMGIMLRMWTSIAFTLPVWLLSGFWLWWDGEQGAKLEVGTRRAPRSTWGE